MLEKHVRREIFEFRKRQKKTNTFMSRTRRVFSARNAFAVFRTLVDRSRRRRDKSVRRNVQTSFGGRFAGDEIIRRAYAVTEVLNDDHDDRLSVAPYHFGAYMFAS